MAEILQTVLPVIVMLAIGMLIRKKEILSREGIDALKRVVMDITLPAVLVGAFATAEYSVNSIILPIIMYLACLSAFGLGCVGKKLLKIPSPFAPFLSTGYEAGMLGYALFAMIYGQRHTASFALLDLGQVLFVFTAYKVLLIRSQGGKMTALETAKSFASSPTVWGIVAGVLLGATGLYKSMAPFGGDKIITSITDFVSGPTGAIILITIGYDLSLDFNQMKRSFKTVVMRLCICAVIMGVLLVVTGYIFPGDKYMTGAVLLMFMLPPPYVLPIMADDAEQREYVSSSLCTLTLITIIYFAVLATVVR